MSALELHVGVFRMRATHEDPTDRPTLVRVEILYPRYTSTGPWIATYPGRLESGEWVEVLPVHGRRP